jgi:hypothetical protein
MSAAKGYERIVGLPRWAEIENSFQHGQKPVNFGRRSLKYRIGLPLQGVRRLDGKKRRGICARRLWLDTESTSINSDRNRDLAMPSELEPMQILARL